jgi:hypothetical protein
MLLYIPLGRPTTPLLLLNLLHSFCWTYCSTPLVRHATPLVQLATSFLLLDLLYFSCSTCCSTPFAWLLHSFCSTLLFYSSCFKLVLTPLFLFLQLWSVEELSKFELFRPNLEGEIFCVQFLFIDEFFLIIHVFGKWPLIMCLYFCAKIIWALYI